MGAGGTPCSPYAILLSSTCDTGCQLDVVDVACSFQLYPIVSRLQGLFNFFYADEDLICAMGGGGGIAFWVKADEETVVRKGLEV